MADTGLTISQLVGTNSQAPDVIGHSDATPSVKLPTPDDVAADVQYVNDFYASRRKERRPYEAVWFQNAALIRGLANTQWNPQLNSLVSRKTPNHRSRDSINVVLPKVKAKLSKFLKNRVTWVVRTASDDYDDILDAQASTKALAYQHKRLQVEESYEEVLLSAMQTGKAFWWFYWDERATAQFVEPAGLTTPEQVHDLALGDVGLEVGSAFEVLPSDLAITRMAKQPEMMRVKARKIEDAEALFPDLKGKLTGEFQEHDLFQYQRQIAQLGAAYTGNYRSDERNKDGKPTHVAVKELFTAPCAAYPQGCYRVVIGQNLAKKVMELPYGLSNRANPYPGVEFSDGLTAGQFWPTTLVEQLAGVQNQRNRLRNRLDEHTKLVAQPKMFVPKQAGLPEGFLNSEAGQQIPINWQPGMPPPQQWVLNPPPISADVYNQLNLTERESDLISNLYPASVGGDNANSGFETNLLQEAADSVHAPDIRRNELALEDAGYKIRRLMKLGYDVPRLIKVIGQDHQAEAFEFSASQIDEHADIVVEAGSGLPQQKHARIEAVLKMDERQLFGPPGDPTRNRRMLRMMDLGSTDEMSNLLERDENRARLENLQFIKNQPVEDPMPWENHDVEYEIHTDLLKSQIIKSWPPEQRKALVRHTILHVKWKNPVNALQLAAVFGLQDVVAEIQQTMMIEQQAQALTPQAQAPAQGQPPATPQGGAPAAKPAAPAPKAPQAAS